MIKPTVGRIVWFYEWFGPIRDWRTELPAIIVKVRNPHSIVVSVFGHDEYNRRVEDLVHDGEDRPIGRDHCTWMPYQVEQAKISDRLGKSLERAGYTDTTETTPKPVCEVSTVSAIPRTTTVVPDMQAEAAKGRKAADDNWFAQQRASEARRIRERALELTLNKVVGIHTAEDIVRTARQFEAYLRGDTSEAA